MAGSVPSTAKAKVYAAKTATQWRLGILFLGVGCVGLLPIPAMLRWFSGDSPPSGWMFLAVFCLLAIPRGIGHCIGALRGLPRLTVTWDGLAVDGAWGRRQAAWRTLMPFEIVTTSFGRAKSANAEIVGTGPIFMHQHVRRFTLADHFETPIDTIAAELNAQRAAALGETALARVAADDEDPVFAGFRMPWVTCGLLAVMAAVFAVELIFPVTPAGPDLAPGIPTLIAMGGLSRAAVLSQGEWYRLFTAPLLHANLAHIVGNGIALLLGGALFERLVGRLWFVAVLAVGALAGSLASVAVNPANLVSVGASGALMAVFAASFVGSFRLRAGSHARARLQALSVRILIPALVPIFTSAAGGQVDYGAHAGGALGGAALGAILLMTWPEGELVAPHRTIAAAVSAVGAILFAVSIGIGIGSYAAYNVALIPPAELPKTTADLLAQAARLVERYPGDPRSHIYLGTAMASAQDDAGSERELRIALAGAEKHAVIFGAQLANVVRGLLAATLAEQRRQDEAREVARPICVLVAGEKNAEATARILAAYHLCP